MDRYTVEWFDRFMDEELDKMGSDYFPLSIKLNKFQNCTYDFIRENTEFLELTQDISDDLKNIIGRNKMSVVKDTFSLSNNIWDVPEPSDYLRLIQLTPFIHDPIDGIDKVFANSVKILKEGQNQAYQRDPFREATREYPNVYREGNFFKIDVGKDTTVYTGALMIYIKDPTFANESALTSRVVNLSNTAIEKICLKTADALRVRTGDYVAQMTVPINSKFGTK